MISLHTSARESFDCTLLFADALQGENDWYPFARDTKPDQNCVCNLYVARCQPTILPSGHEVLCLEFVGDRFLRKMVRVLTATTMREVHSRIQQKRGHTPHDLSFNDPCFKANFVSLYDLPRDEEVLYNTFCSLSLIRIHYKLPTAFGCI